MPTRGFELAFTKMNFWLHFVCPFMTLILLFSVEADMKLSLKESVICLIPFFLYASVSGHGRHHRGSQRRLA